MLDVDDIERDGGCRPAILDVEMGDGGMRA